MKMHFVINYIYRATLTRVINENVSSDEISESSIEELFKFYRIYSMATGDEEGCLKFYLFARHVIKLFFFYLITILIIK